MKTIFIPCEYKTDLLVLKEILARIRDYRRVGLITTAQHLDQLEGVKRFLGDSGKKVVVVGQVLGCDVSSAKRIEGKVDAFLYIGSGKFHPIGISISTEKPLFVVNPYSGSVGEISKEERDSWLKKRKGRVARALEAKKFGVLISTKEGQFNQKTAFRVREKLEVKGKTVFLFAGNELNPGRLLGYDIDCWVNTACPRLVDDEFDKAVVNADEVELLLQFLGLQV